MAKGGSSSSTVSPAAGSKAKPNPKVGLDKCICCICDEVVREACGRKPGDEAIECSGTCAGWLHRRCAGLTKQAFALLSTSSDPFFCPHCRLDKQELEAKSLRDLVRSLSSHLSLVSDELSSLKKSVSRLNDDGNSSPPSVGLDSPQRKTFAQAIQSSSDVNKNDVHRQKNERGRNVVLFGVEEYTASQLISRLQLDAEILHLQRSTLAAGLCQARASY